MANAQQTTNWTAVSSSVWESVTDDGLVRVECRVAGGVTVLGNETMGCTNASTYSDPLVFGSNSLEISASSTADGNLNFYFFDAITGDPVHIVNPILHADKVGTFAVVAILSDAATGNFNITNGTWTELSSNGPIFQSTPTLFNIDDTSLLISGGGECVNGSNIGTGGGSLRVENVTSSIEMDVDVTGGLLSLLTASDEVEFVLTNLIIADPKIEVTKTVIENFGDPVSIGNTIDYTITVENTGNVALNAIDLMDTFTDIDTNTLSLTSGPTFNSSTMGSGEGTLLPTENATYLASFALNSTAIEAGGVSNQITVLADSPYGTDDVNDLSDDGIDTDGNIEDDPTISYFPTAENETVTICEEDTIDINVLLNDDFGGNGPASNSIFIVSSASSGTVLVNDNGTSSNPLDDYITYTSATGYTGSDSFVYGIRDSKGYTQHATVSITEQAAPDAGTDGTLTICEGATVNESQLFSQLGGTPDSGGTWSPAMTGAGTYTYTVAATAPCTLDSTSEVVVSEQAAPDAGTDGTLTICEEATVNETQLFAQLGGTPDSGGTWSPAMAGAGTYTYTVAATSPCTVDSTSELVVSEQALPNAGKDGTLIICEGATVNETQLFAQLGGTPDSGGTWSPAMAGAGTYTYTVTATAPCTVDDTSEVVVSEQVAPDAGTDGTLTICKGATVNESQLFAQLGGTPDSGGTWSPAMAGAGTYTYTVTATAPCTLDSTSEVVVSEQAAPDAGTDGTLTICEEATVNETQLFAQLGGTPDSGGTWSPAMAGAGTYTYTVVATAPCTVDDTSEVVVSEQAAPDAGSDGTLIICEGSTVTETQLFAQLGGTPNSGGTWSPAMAGGGTYTYTVTATAPCTVDDISEVIVSEQAAPNAGTDGTLTICEGSTVNETQLFAQLGGTPDSGGTWSPTMAGAGTYTYTVTATAPCTVDDTSEVVVSEQAAPDAGSDGTLTICEGSTVTETQLFAQLGGTPDSGGTWSPAMAGAGTYTYTVTATSPCTVDSTSEVVVSEQATPDAGTDGTFTICEGATVNESQLFAQLGGTPDSGGTWSPAMAGAGTYTYTVAATAPCTVDNTSEVVVSEQAAPDAGSDGTLTICEGATVNETQLFAQLSGTPDSGGIWSPAMAGAGTYTYTVAATSPCTINSTSEVVVSEQAAPDTGTDGTLTICEGSTVNETQLFAQLGGTPDSGGTWSPTPSGAGTYTYTVAATSPCTIDSTSEVVVFEQAAPNAGSDGTLTICEGSTVNETQLFAQLGGTPNSGGTWSPTPSGSGTYTYTVAATAPCTVDNTSEVVVSEQTAPDAGTDGTLTICEGSTVNETQLFAQLGGTPNSGGTWSPTMAGAGTYTYTVTATAPCTVDDISEVIVSEQAAPDAGTDGTLTICESSTVNETQLFAQLGGTPVSGGTWSPAMAGAGTYTYMVAATAPCTVDDTSEVVVSEQATPDAGTDGTLTICEGATVNETQLFAQLGGTPDSGGNWSPAMGGAGTYTYTVTATSPCTINSTSEVVVSEQAAPDTGTDGTLIICEGSTVTETQLFAQLGGTPDSGGNWSPAMGGAGTYTYTVTATSPCTINSTSEVVVSEQAAPDTGTDGTLIICEGSTVTESQLFAQLSGTPDSGGTWSPAMAGAGTYTYTVTATAPCTVDDISEVIVSEQAAPDAGTDGTLTICEGATVNESQLFAQLGGTPDSGGTWSPTPSGAGTYTYTVAATAPCTIDGISEVIVSEQAAPNAGTDGTLTICESTTVTESQLFAQLGGTPDSSGTWSPAISGAGTYTYTVAATTPCTLDSTSEVIVSEQAAPDAGADGTLAICESTTVTEAQLFAQLGGTPDSGGTWSPAMAGAGTYTYTVAATAPCTVDDTSEVVVSEQAAPDAGTDGTLTICEGATVNETQLFAQLGGTPDSGGTWSPTMAGAGTYTYTVTAKAPCTVDDTSEVVVSEQAAPDAGTDGTLTICEGETVTESQLFSQLGGSPESGGTWSPTPSGAGTYAYTVAATAPCTVDDTSEVVVSEQAAPDAGTDGTLTICQGSTVTESQLFAQLGGNPDSGGTWSPTPSGAGTYTYTIEGFSCPNATATVTVNEETLPDAGTSTSLIICPDTTVSTAQLFSLLGTSETGGTWSPNPENAGAGVYVYSIAGNICGGNSEASVTVTISNLDSDGDTIIDCKEDLDTTDRFNDCDSIGGTPLSNSDCDNDNLSEEEENLLGTDPKKPDTDGDGVLDGQEVTDNTDPLDSCDFLLVSQTLEPSADWKLEDCDMDNLNNQQEVMRGTDPANPDTDGDTITDGQEVLDNTDPLDPCDSVGGNPPANISCELFVEIDIVKPGDILNGAFKIINIDRFPDNHVEIFNRWGILVWESEGYDNQNNAFEGSSQGRITIIENQKLPSGVYFYQIKYVSKGEDKMISGYLYLMRQ
ncbi:gliding motility-associated C-terminal domain-containing protein [Zobellia russellii]|uniref:T9SS type B sorting domain-containing protein n=1 Tax=Zobellia russellii TaxID=248907 RepID=UPI0037DC47C7